jgi:predicted SAM-dependent methyltransferase
MPLSATPLRFFVGTSVQGFRPAGYTTIDILPEHKPDIVADASDLSMIEPGSADEFYASHVLEHFSFPRALLVLAGWARVLKPGGLLKLAVPDMEVYAHFLLNGHNPFITMRDIYGTHSKGESGPQAHHFGYTRRMLVQILAVMGFGDYDYWRSELPEAANTWKYGENQERIGLSLNLSAIKRSDPIVDIPALYDLIMEQQVHESFMVTVRNILADKGLLCDLNEIDCMLFQKLNYKYLQAMHDSEHYRTMHDELLRSTTQSASKPWHQQLRQLLWRK